MTTVNPIQNTTYTLTSGNNPILFGLKTDITNLFQGAIYGDASSNWNVTNLGTLQGFVGVDLTSNSVVTNLGHITGYGNTGFGGSGGYGVILTAGGAVNNAAYGSTRGVISGAQDGILVEGAAGTVTNGGQVTCGINGGLGGSDIYLRAGGTVTNLLGGVLDGSYSGISVAYGAGTVTNSGTISASGAFGIALDIGGKVTNGVTGAISGGANTGIYGDGASVTVDNYGAIAASSYGVQLKAGGTVNNRRGVGIGVIPGSISGAYGGVIISGGAGIVTNAGSIKATGAGPKSIAVQLAAGGTLANSGSISAGDFGVEITGGVGHAQNSGTIATSQGIGVFLGAGGTVVNAFGASIVGQKYGVEVVGGGVVTDAGKISSTNGSVQFTGGSANTLNLLTGATLTGKVDCFTARGAINTLTLKGAGAAANVFVGFNYLKVFAGGVWTLGANSTFGATTLSTGTLAITGAVSTQMHESLGATLNLGGGGALTLHGSSVFAGSVGGTGTVKLFGAATATVQGAVGAGDAFAYTGTASGDLVLDDLAVGGANLFHGKIAGFAAGDKIDAGAPFGSSTTFVFSENAALTSGVLTLTDGATHASLTLLGNHVAANFHLAGDGGGGTLVTYL